MNTEAVRGNQEHGREEDDGMTERNIRNRIQHSPSVPNPTEKMPAEAESETLWTMSRQKKLVLICLTLGSMEYFLCSVLLGPIYPGEAKSRGINQFYSSAVFSAYAGTQVIAAPLIAKALPIVGARILYIGGAFISASGTILIGCLGMLPRDDGPALFITFSFILRIVMSAGGTAWLHSGLAIAKNTFRNNAAAAMGLVETGMCLGVVLGPVSSGMLYQAGGFSIPFWLLGGLGYLFIPMYILLLDTTKEHTEAASMLSILRTPWSFVLCIAIYLTAMLSIIVDPILELHMEEVFGVGPAHVGLALSLLLFAWSIGVTVSTLVVDKVEDCRGLLVIGFSLLSLAFFFIGPSSLTGLSQYQNLWLKLACVALVGLAIGLSVVPTFPLLALAAKKTGMPDTDATEGAVSGLWTTVFAFGELVGPVSGGWMVFYYGFDWATTVCAIIALGMVIIMVPFIVYDKCCSKTRDEESISKSE